MMLAVGLPNLRIMGLPRKNQVQRYRSDIEEIIDKGILTPKSDLRLKLQTIHHAPWKEQLKEIHLMIEFKYTDAK